MLQQSPTTSYRARVWGVEERPQDESSGSGTAFPRSLEPGVSYPRGEGCHTRNKIPTVKDAPRRHPPIHVTFGGGGDLQRPQYQV